MKLEVKHGASRVVILTKNYAIKLPTWKHYRLFLHGLLANMQEGTWGEVGYEGFAPVIRSNPLGFYVVMKRAREMTMEEYLEFDYLAFVDRPDYRIPAENKPDSFGWIDGKIVAIDYGS